MLFFIHVIIVGNENLNKKKKANRYQKKRTIHDLRVIFFSFFLE